ncbi:hypothetical protein GC169_03395 [bacterium]|nr:hypothetical protein [bacterium]
MRALLSGAALCALAAMTGFAAHAQAPADGGRVEAGYVTPRTSFGHPDLQGVWSNSSNTGLTRPSQFKSLIMTPDEAREAQARNPSNIRQKTDDNQSLADGLLDGKDLAAGRGYNAFWIDPGTSYALVKGTYRTSWIVEPDNGQIPFTAEARKLMAAERAARGTGYDNPEERSLGERCIIGFGGTGGPPMMNVLYNNHYQISQSPDHVVITVEMNHDARIIPLRGKHRPDVLAPYLGDSVGYWDGDTLVVETINMNPLQAIGNTRAPLTAKGKITERFTRYNDRQILYEFTVEDPVMYSQPWRGEMSLNALGEPIYEYACHEGNYGLEGILAGGRNDDKKGVSRERALGEEG